MKKFEFLSFSYEFFKEIKDEPARSCLHSKSCHNSRGHMAAHLDYAGQVFLHLHRFLAIVEACRISPVPNG
jgi:hypothetical protein